MWLAFAVANVADFVIQGAAARFAIVVSAILVTITGLAYALALRPRVIAEPSGLMILNPFRDHHVPWAAITAVDTGDWVRVHYARRQGPARASPPSSAASKAVSCWALYISARTKRRAARPARAAPRPRSGLLRPLPVSSAFAMPVPEPGYAENSRLPEEAKYLASLPVGQGHRRPPGYPRGPGARPPRAETRKAQSTRPVPSPPGGHGPRSPRQPCPRSPC